MKKILISGLVIMGLSGCVSIPAYDNNEYMLFSDIESKTVMLKDKCGADISDDIVGLKALSHLASTYTKYPNNNKEIFVSANELHGLVEELEKRYEGDKIPSKRFCELKLDNISTAADTIRNNLGNRRPQDGIF